MCRVLLGISSREQNCIAIWVKLCWGKARLAAAERARRRFLIALGQLDEQIFMWLHHNTRDDDDSYYGLYFIIEAFPS